ncbi:MAG: lipoate--protein ligase family protein [Methanomassiliicoccales archaeon]|nr:lipoate--protein ligase family protein [Methanomassiliicoccales archaeon]
MLWRLIDTDLASPAYTSAADEAIVMARQKNIAPNTLHLYRRDRPTVSIGYFENVEESVNLEVAKERGVQLVRRMSGGSAIFTDPNQIIYSVVVEKDMVPESPNETFPIVCGGIIKALNVFGIEAKFKPINDILVNGKKISGSAQTRKWDVVLQHGTLIVDADFALMFKVLRTKKKKVKTQEGMTSLAKELGRVPPMDEVKAAVVKGFSQQFDVNIVKGVLTHFEQNAIERLIEEKYGKEEYTLRK